jgi:hypothetical protein
LLKDIAAFSVRGKERTRVASLLLLALDVYNFRHARYEYLVSGCIHNLLFEVRGLGFSSPNQIVAATPEKLVYCAWRDTHTQTHLLFFTGYISNWYMVL